MLVSVEGFEAPPVSKVPDAQRLVIRGAEEVLPARVEHQPAHPIVVPRQGEEAEARGHVPDPDRLVSGSGREEGARQTRLGLARPGLRARIRRVGRGDRLLDGRRGGLRRPGDALHHVLVLPHLHLRRRIVSQKDLGRLGKAWGKKYFALFGGEEPDADGLIVGAGGE